jgi:hypothetical protein
MIALGAGALGLALGTGPVRSQKDVKMVERWIKDASPGVIELGRPERLDRGPVTMEIVVKPAKVSPDDDLLLRVDLVSTAEFRKLGATAQSIAGGTVAFYPPARLGVEHRLVVPMSVAGGKTELAEPLTAVVTLLAGHRDRKLHPSSIEVIDARLLCDGSNCQS